MGEFDEKEIYFYIIEGIGEDIIFENVDFKVIDCFEKVIDKDGVFMAWCLACEEGLLLGYFVGFVVVGLLQFKDEFMFEDVVVVVIYDYGSCYVGKIYNDDWMWEWGFLECEFCVCDLLNMKYDDCFIIFSEMDIVQVVFKMMKDYDIFQLLVMWEGEMVGLIMEIVVLFYLLENFMNYVE